MKWVTREHVKVDRVACPWLIRKFVDPKAEFLFVSADKVMQVAREQGVIPYDVPDVELGHHQGRCSFEAIIEKYRITDPAVQLLARIVHGGGGEATHIVCGFLASDQHSNPLIATLPRVLKVDMVQAGSDEWIESGLRFALRGLDKGLIGASTVMSRLSELMFVEAVRLYATTLPAEEKGWLAGVRDRYVGKALALMHGRPDHPWTAESLACEVSLSRSAFSDRFTAVIGMPPKRYLISWRLQVAKEMLREGRKPIAQIAHEVGYGAEVAFNRAFKREFGAPPAAWRKQAQPSKN